MNRVKKKVFDSTQRLHYIYYKYFYLFFDASFFRLLLFIYIIELECKCVLQDNFINLK